MLSRSFFLKGIIFLALLVLLLAGFAGLDHTLRQPAPPRFQRQAFDAQEHVSALLLGDSRMAAAAEQSLLPPGWYNFAAPGDNLRDTHAKLLYALKTQPIRLVVLQLDSHVFSTYSRSAPAFEGFQLLWRQI